MDIGQRIKYLRELQGLTQEELGKLIGVNKATINRYETGIIDIKRTTAIKLAQVFSVSPADIMGWTNNINNTPIDSYTDEEKRLINNYRVLDDIDRAEIRGEIKQMLKADKYSAAPEFDIAEDIGKEINNAFKKGSINSK